MQRVTFDSILVQPDAVREIGPRFYTALPEVGAAAPYDRKAAVYDAIVGRSLYHRLLWGTSARAYSRFARAAFDAAGDGCFAEAGCGSLLFTAPMYREPRGAFALLTDRSVQMLRRAARRLGSDDGSSPDGVAFLHSDIAALPVRAGMFSSILCLNVLHVPCDAAAITAEFSRVLIPGRGRLFVSSLVRSGRWSDACMAALHRAGELAAPVTVDELQQRVAAGGRSWNRPRYKATCATWSCATPARGAEMPATMKSAPAGLERHELDLRWMSAGMFPSSASRPTPLPSVEVGPAG